MSIQENIDLFFGWIRDRRKEIDHLPRKCRLSSELYRRILLLSLLDTLSKCAFPNESKNRKRFVKLIDCHADWKYKDYVNLPQLQYLLKRSACTDLRKEVENRVNKWRKGTTLRPEEADVSIHELDNFKCSKCEDLIEKARYPSLLWRMRNVAVHEFRRPGRGMAAISNDHSTPYVHGSLELNGSHSWEFYVPSEVISQIAKKCSENLEVDLKRKCYDPYDSFCYGSSWYP